MLTGIKAIKGSFLIGLLLVWVYVIIVITDALMDLGIYVEYDVNSPVSLSIITLFTTVIGLVFLLNVLKQVNKSDDLQVRGVVSHLVRIGVVLVFLPALYYILIRLGFFWYFYFSIVILLVRIFNYLYVVGLIFLVYSFILLLRDT